MLKKLFHGMLIYAVGDMVVTGVTGFILLPVYTKFLSKAGYATYSIVMTNTTLMTFICHFGITSAFSRLYFEYSRQNKTNDYLSTIFIGHNTYSLVLFLLFFLFGEPFWQLISPQTAAFPFLPIALALAFFSFIPGLFSLLLRIQEKAHLFVVFQLVSVILIVCSTFYSLVYMQGNIETMLSNLVVANSFIWFISVILISRRFRFTVKFNYILNTLNFAWPILLSYLAYFLLNKYGLIFLQRYETLEQLSYYTFAQQVSLILIIAGNSFGKVVQPMIYSQESINLTHLKKIIFYYRILLSFIALALMASAGPIIELLGSSKYQKSKYIFFIFIAANYIYLFPLIESFILMYYKRSKQIMFTTMGGALLTSIVGMYYIPSYGILAGAVALLVGNLFIAIVNIYTTKKILHKEHLQ